MPKDFQQQNDSFDEKSLNSMQDTEEEFYDDLEEDLDDEQYDEEVERKHKKAMGRATSSFQLESKHKTFLIGGLVVIIALLIIFNPFGNKEGNGEEDGVASSILGVFQQDENPTETTTDTSGSIESMMAELESGNPGYTVVRNEDDTITLTGELEGQEHVMTYNAQGEIIAETLGGEDLMSNESVDTYIEDPSSTTTEGTNVEVGEYEIPEDKVLVNKADFEKSLMSQPAQTVSEQLDENGNPVIEQYDDKFIVMYEKLPLRGNTPTLYSQVIETGEVIIFPVTLEQYLSIEDKGSTVIQVTVTKMSGITSYENIILVDWK